MTTDSPSAARGIRSVDRDGPGAKSVSEVQRSSSSAPAKILTDEEVALLLQRTSRTFALAIPQLPHVLRKQVGIAYLLFRIIDSVEDGDAIVCSSKVRLLRQISVILESADSDPLPAEKIAQFAGVLPTLHDAELELHRVTASVIETARTFPGPRQRMIFSAVSRCARGMSRFLCSAGSAGHIRLQTTPQLHEYCFCVAGLVGEMLTQLFVADDPSLSDVSEQLAIHAAAFGEALQLVNILRDSEGDLRMGRTLIPPDITRGELMALANRDLDRAAYYIQLLQQSGAHPGVLSFVELPVQLARETLQQVRQHGPGAKVSRPDVMRIAAAVVDRHSSRLGAPDQATGGSR